MVARRPALGAHSKIGATLWIGFMSLFTQLTVAADLPSETPAQFHVDTSRFDYVERDEMIPMRDGVKLRTIILIPKGAKAAPMLMTRTPYDASDRLKTSNSPHLISAVLEMT